MALTYRTIVGSTSGLSSYTLSAVPIGTASSSRYVVIAMSAKFLGTTAASISTLTIGGVSATIVTTATGTGSNIATTTLAYALVPTGTTADIVVTYSRAALRCAAAVWTISGSGTISVDTSNQFGGSANPSPTATLDLSTSAVTMGVGARFTNTGSHIWSGLTKRGQTDFGSGTISAADATLVAGANAISVSAGDAEGASVSAAFLGTAPAMRGAKVHNGTTWVECPVKVHNGTSWVQAPVKVHNGTSWV